ncbi:MAG: hypothetical protein AAGA66_02750, partial [Bacteroidota bacterium]
EPSTERDDINGPLFGDNSFIFYSNGRLDYRTGTVKEYQGNFDELETTGTWSFVSNGDSLRIQHIHVFGDETAMLNEAPIVVFIEKLTENELITEEVIGNASTNRTVFEPRL